MVRSLPLYLSSRLMPMLWSICACRFNLNLLDCLFAIMHLSQEPTAFLANSEGYALASGQITGILKQMSDRPLVEQGRAYGDPLWFS